MSTKGRGTPHLARARAKALGSRLSDAFAQSSANKTAEPLLEPQISSIARRARNNASEVPELDLKPNCVGQMRPSAPASFKRCSNTIANSLYPTVERDIGR